MTSRTRTNIINYTGSRQNSNGVHSYKLRQEKYERCVDVADNRNGENPLEVTRKQVMEDKSTSQRGSVLTGRTGTQIGSIRYHNEPSHHSVVLPTPPFQILLESELASEQRARALTNPSRPEYLAPAFVAEMRDIPRMVKYGAELAKHINDMLYNRRRRGADRWSNSGDISPEYLIQEIRPTLGNALSKAKQLAMANLTLQFGVVPLVNDIASSFVWPETVQSRLKELERLYQGSGLKRRVRLIDESTEFNVNDVALSATPNYWGTISVLQKAERWAVIRYRPTSQTPTLPSLTANNKAGLRNMLSGLTLDAIGQTAWELLPWSWLSDYFGSVGDILQANNNHLQTRFVGTLMTHTTTKWKHGQVIFTYANGHTVTLTRGEFLAETKRRVPMTGGNLPSYGIPFLGARQLSILGSIHATRAFR